MPDWLTSDFFREQLLWGVGAWQLTAALLLIFLSLLSKRVVTSFFRGWLRRRSKRTQVQWDGDVSELMPAPVAFTVQVVFWMAVATLLELPREPIDLRAFAFKTLLVVLAFALVWVSYRLLDVLARVAERAASNTETKLDDQLVPLARKALKVTVTVVVAVMVLQNLEIEVASLIASLGITGLVLALAAKDTVANFFGSVIVFTDQPFQIGDWIEVGGTEGIVEEVGFRTTLVRRFDKSQVILPNHEFTTMPIVNHSRRPMRRLKLTVGLGYETTPTQMRAFIGEVWDLLEAHDGLDQETHTVRFTELGDSSLNVLVISFSKSTAWDEFAKVQQDVLLGIMDIVEALGLEIAFPTRTLYLRQEQASARGDRNTHGNPSAV